jgi:hypothetical protein
MAEYEACGTISLLLETVKAMCEISKDPSSPQVTEQLKLIDEELSNFEKDTFVLTDVCYVFKYFSCKIEGVYRVVEV